MLLTHKKRIKPAPYYKLFNLASLLSLRYIEQLQTDALVSIQRLVHILFIYNFKMGCLPQGKQAVTESCYPTYGTCWVL